MVPAENETQAPATDAQDANKRRRGRRGPRRSEDGDGGGGGGGGASRGGGGRRDGYDTEPRRAGELRKVLESGNPAATDQLAEAYGQAWGNKPPWVKNRFATYQIRGIIGEIERLRRSDFAADPEAQRAFRLLRPRVAYVARRYHDEDLYEFARVIRACVDAVGMDATRFRHFLDLFDASLYYFRAAGGR